MQGHLGSPGGAGNRPTRSAHDSHEPGHVLDNVSHPTVSLRSHDAVCRVLTHPGPPPDATIYRPPMPPPDGPMVARWGTTHPSAPLVVALHGNGTSEHSMIEIAPWLPHGPVAYVAVRGPITGDSGFRWYTATDGRPDPASLATGAAWFLEWLDDEGDPDRPVPARGLPRGRDVRGRADAHRAAPLGGRGAALRRAAVRRGRPDGPWTARGHAGVPRARHRRHPHPAAAAGPHLGRGWRRRAARRCGPSARRAATSWRARSSGTSAPGSPTASTTCAPTARTRCPTARTPPGRRSPAGGSPSARARHRTSPWASRSTRRPRSRPRSCRSGCGRGSRRCPT